MSKFENQPRSHGQGLSSEDFLPRFLESGCLFSISNSDQIWLGFGNALRSDKPSYTSLSIYTPDFFLKDEKPWRIFQNSFQVHRSQLIELLESDSRGKFFNPLCWEPAESELFRKTFIELKNQFKSGILKKAVPVVFERSKISTKGFQSGLILNLLRNTRGLPLHLYGFWNDEEGIVGATPETLFEISGSVLSTIALAGTRLKTDLKGSLLEDPKEMAEHQFVIDGITSSLSEFGEFRIGQTQVLELPTLFHLKTPLTFEIRSPEFQKIVEKLHPTPALGAFPRAEGKLWLEQFGHQIERFRFGAPFGMIDPNTRNESRCVVAIRNIQWGGDSMYLGAGCGVIEASELDQEWTEIQGKILSVKKLFGI